MQCAYIAGLQLDSMSRRFNTAKMTISLVIELGQYQWEFISVVPILVGDGSLISPAFSASCFVLLNDLFMVCHIWERFVLNLM